MQAGGLIAAAAFILQLASHIALRPPLLDGLLEARRALVLRQEDVGAVANRARIALLGLTTRDVAQQRTAEVLHAIEALRLQQVEAAEWISITTDDLAKLQNAKRAGVSDTEELAEEAESSMDVLASETAKMIALRKRIDGEVKWLERHLLGLGDDQVIGQLPALIRQIKEHVGQLDAARAQVEARARELEGAVAAATEEADHT
jgi:hypothetical protein